MDANKDGCYYYLRALWCAYIREIMSETPNNSRGLFKPPFQGSGDAVPPRTMRDTGDGLMRPALPGEQGRAPSSGFSHMGNSGIRNAGNQNEPRPRGTGPLGGSGVHGSNTNFQTPPAGFNVPPPGFTQASPRTDSGLRYGPPPPGFAPPPAGPRASQPLVSPQPAFSGGPVGPATPMPGANNAFGTPRPSIKLSKRRSRLLVAMIVFVLVMPSLATMAEMISLSVMAFHTYSGVRHLLDVKNIYTGAHGHLTTALLDPNTLNRAHDDLVAARDELQHVSTMLNQDVVFNGIASVFPQQIATVRALAKIGVDAVDMGQKLVQDAQVLAPSLQGNVLAADNKKPLVTPQVLSIARSTIEYMLPLLSDVQTQTGSLSLNTLPFINDQQREQLAQAILALPQVRTDLAQAHDMMDAIGWLAGADHPRSLLIETMDRAELRPTGGFTGQYGELSIDAGRVAPFSLQNIGLYEENNPTALSNGQLAPAPFTWWPVGNFGLRDSNLSADFPTSAKLAMQRYQYEFGHQLDGVIVFSPFLIQDILGATGPIVLPQYNETINSQNLEQRLHYYQLDNNGIRKEELVEGVEDPGQARKLFTKHLSQKLMDQLRSAAPDELFAVARTMLHSLRTKNLQIYVTNQAIEDLLVKYNAAALMDRSDKHDGLYVVQANISASKASQYVRTFMHDTITLDAKGGATHVLQMRLAYNQIGPVYGLDTYHDYVRVYVPASSQYLWGDGFEQSDQPYCGAGFGYCPTYDVYHNGDLLCPAGLNDSGYRTATLGDPYDKVHPLMAVGDPTNMNSDEQGRAMFGGWITIPKNCSATVTLSWYVPPTTQGSYTLDVQRQSSTFFELDLTILSNTGNCLGSGKHYDNVLGQTDMTFTLKMPTGAGGTACVAQPDA